MKCNRVTVLGATVLALALFAVPALSHHSTAMFLSDNPITIEGTLTEIAWANPHSLFFLDARPMDQPNAPIKNWSVETPSIKQLIDMGWNKDTIKVGTKVKVKGFWRKDQRPQILFIEITSEDGKHFATKRTNYEGGN
jgi:uncharacterized protein DUF6152